MASVLRRVGISAGILGAIALVFLAGAVTSAFAIRSSVQRYWTVMTEPRTPNAVNFAGYVTIGGVQQWITIRGKDRNNPVLLHLHGGPGTAVSDISYTVFSALEDAFVLVQWDQRGAGRSNVEPDKLLPTMTYDRLVEDGSEVLAYLQKRFGRQKILVFGQSWGTVLGLGLAKRHPEQIAAYLAVGQFNNLSAMAVTTVAESRKEADRRGETLMVAQLNRVGPMPATIYDQHGISNGALSNWIDSIQTSGAKLGQHWYKRTEDDMNAFFTAAALMSPSVTNAEVFRVLFGKAPDGRPVAQLTAGLAAWDGVTISGGQLAVPYILMMGKHDNQTPLADAKLLYHAIEAPFKHYVELPYAAHYVWPEQPGLAFYELTKELIPFALPAAGPGWVAP